MIVGLPAQGGLREALERQGAAALQAGDYPTAVAAYEAAAGEAPQPAHTLAMAIAYGAWGGHCVESKAAFERFFGVCRQCPLEAKGRAALAVARARCAAPVEVASPKGPATVVVDGAEIGPAPQRVDVWAGSHVVGLRSESAYVEEALCAAAGETTRVSLALPTRSKKRGAATVVARARGHEQAALRQLRAQDYCGAAASLEQAHAAVSVPKVLFNLGLVYDKWPGHCAAANEAYRRYLDGCAECGKAIAARQRLDALRTTCAGSVTITATPPGATLQVNGAAVRGPLSLRPGNYVVTAQLPGHVAAYQAFHVSAGAQRTISLSLASVLPPKAPPAAEPPPVVVAQATPVAGDGSAVAAVGWVGVGLGAAAVVLGGVFYGLALGTHADIETLQDEAGGRSASVRAEIADHIDTFDRQSSVAYAGYGVGGGLVAVGVVLLIVDLVGGGGGSGAAAPAPAFRF